MEEPCADGWATLRMSGYMAELDTSTRLAMTRQKKPSDKECSSKILLMAKTTAFRSLMTLSQMSIPFHVITFNKLSLNTLPSALLMASEGPGLVTSTKRWMMVVTISKTKWLKIWTRESLLSSMQTAIFKLAVFSITPNPRTIMNEMTERISRVLMTPEFAITIRLRLIHFHKTK